MISSAGRLVRRLKPSLNFDLAAISTATATGRVTGNATGGKKPIQGYGGLFYFFSSFFFSRSFILFRGRRRSAANVFRDGKGHAR